MQKTIAKLALAALLAITFHLGAARDAAAQARTNLPVVVISVTVSIWPAIVADKKGFFKSK